MEGCTAIPRHICHTIAILDSTSCYKFCTRILDLGIGRAERYRPNLPCRNLCQNWIPDKWPPGQKATKLVFLWRNLKSPDSVFFYL